MKNDLALVIFAVVTNIFSIIFGFMVGKLMHDEDFRDGLVLSIKESICKVLPHKWRYMHSSFLVVPFKECERCGERKEITQEQIEEAIRVSIQIAPGEEK